MACVVVFPADLLGSGRYLCQLVFLSNVLIFYGVYCYNVLDDTPRVAMETHDQSAKTNIMKIKERCITGERLKSVRIKGNMSKNEPQYVIHNYLSIDKNLIILVLKLYFSQHAYFNIIRRDLNICQHIVFNVNTLMSHDNTKDEVEINSVTFVVVIIILK